MVEVWEVFTWLAFYKKDNADSTNPAGSGEKSSYFVSFAGQPGKFLFQQVPKPITFYNKKIKLKIVDW